MTKYQRKAFHQIYFDWALQLKQKSYFKILNFGRKL